MWSGELGNKDSPAFLRSVAGRTEKPLFCLFGSFLDLYGPTFRYFSPGGQKLPVFSLLTAPVSAPQKKGLHSGK
jgi:hypothetical protein